MLSFSNEYIKRMYVTIGNLSILGIIVRLSRYTYPDVFVDLYLYVLIITYADIGVCVSLLRADFLT